MVNLICLMQVSLRKRYLLLVVCIWAIVGSFAHASNSLGIGAKVANDIPRLTLFWEQQSAGVAFEGNVMFSDPKGIVTLWEGRTAWGERFGPYIGIRAVNAAGHKLSVGPEVGIHYDLVQGPWRAKARVGAKKINDVVYVWDASIHREFIWNTVVSVGVQQNISWRTETWPRLALSLQF